MLKAVLNFITKTVFCHGLNKIKEYLCFMLHIDVVDSGNLEETLHPVVNEESLRQLLSDSQQRLENQAVAASQLLSMLLLTLFSLEC